MRTTRGWMVVLTLVLSLAPATVLAQSIEPLIQQADAAQTAKKWQEAEALWRKVIQMDPKNALAYSNLCDALNRQNKPDEALQLCRQAIQLDPKSALAYKNLGNVLYFQKKLEEALTAYRQAAQLDPNYAPAHNNIGNVLLDQNKPEEAIAAYRRAIAADPNFVIAYNGLGNGLYGQKKLEEAISAYRTAIKLDPNNATAYNWLGNALFDQNKLEEAITAYRTAIKLDPNYTYAYYNLGRVLYEQKKLGEAITAYRTALNLPDQTGTPASAHALAYNGLGNALKNQNKLEEAITAYRTAIKLNPNDAYVYNGLGNALKDQNKLEEAIAAYRRAIKLDLNYATAYNGLGNALSDQNKLEEAIAAYRMAIKLDPNYAYAYNNLGLVLKDQNKLEEAITAYRTALKVPEITTGTPTTAHTLAHSNLGVVLQAQGKLEEAIHEFEQAIKLDPKYALAQSNLKEAQRLLALKRTPQPDFIDDSAYLPSLSQEPKLPIFRGTARIIPTTTEGSPIAAGWVVKRQGNTIWIVTNRHVVTDSKTKRLVEKPLQVEFFSDLPNEKRPRYTAKILQATPDSDEIDLAVVQIIDDRLPKDIQPLAWNTDRLRANQRIYVIGHPYNKENPWDSAFGEVTSSMQQGALLPIDAKVATGNSGGPVINEQNQVIGIFVAIRSKSTVAASTLETVTNLANVSPATGDIGLAYRMTVVIEKLRAWKILD